MKTGLRINKDALLENHGRVLQESVTRDGAWSLIVFIKLHIDIVMDIWMYAMFMFI